MADGENLLTLRGISKGYETGGNRIEVLAGVDYEVPAGASVAVVGASGIGKSTLLHIMGALDRPDSGTLLFRGEDVFRMGDEKLAAFRNRSVGFVFQFHHLLHEFSAVENVMMPALVAGRSRRAARDAAGEILDRVGLGSRLAHFTGELSGGQQQRVALARALVMRPTLLLADEPTGNLDEENSKEIHGLLMELNAEMAMTMVVVTHNMELADLMNERVTLAHGQLQLKNHTG